MNDAEFMARALDLAEAMKGRTGPNPAVGCVLVKDGVIVGEGATGGGGRPHAEEEALKHSGENARGAVAYVSMEPCAKRSNRGKSCAQLLIDAEVARVVAAVEDPHPFAAGAGPAALAQAGVVVELGLRREEARFLHAEFFAKGDRT
jgi:diaminohydroxyphosphoribosylaminopyrimidine deaminase/5-amino-6-(5-phosphoribosylamino)uracil reductase